MVIKIPVSCYKMKPIVMLGSINIVLKVKIIVSVSGTKQTKTTQIVSVNLVELTL